MTETVIPLPSVKSEEEERAPKRRKLSHQECEQKLQQMEKDLQCPICQGVCDCPFSFACSRHFACHSCMLGLLESHSILRYRDVSDRFELFSRFRCPYCNDASSSASSNSGYVRLCDSDRLLVTLHPAPPLILNALYPDTPTCKCPYCPLTSTVSAVCTHLEQLRCLEMRFRCPLCRQGFEYTPRGLRDHLTQVCPSLACPYSGCRFTGNYPSLVDHCKPHRMLESLSNNTAYIAERLLRNHSVVSQQSDPVQLNRLMDGLSQFNHRLHQNVSELICTLADTLDQDASAFLFKSRCSRLCRAFNSQTNQLGLLPPLYRSPSVLGDTDSDSD